MKGCALNLLRAAALRELMDFPTVLARLLETNFRVSMELVNALFFVLGRDVNGREGVGAIEDGELADIVAVGFDANAATTANQRNPVMARPPRARPNADEGSLARASAGSTENSRVFDGSRLPRGGRWEFYAGFLKRAMKSMAG